MPRYKSHFFINILTLAAGNGAGLVVTVLITPILTRILSPADFGIHATYIAIVSIGGIVSTLSYELAIPLARDDVDAGKLFFLSSFSSFVISTITYAVLSTHTLKLIPAELYSYLYFIPVGMFITGINQALIQVGVRVYAFSVIAKSRFVHGLTTAIAGLLLSVYGLTFLALIISSILGWLSFTLTLLLDKNIRIFLHNFLIFTKSFQFDEFKSLVNLAQRYIKFPLFNSTANLMNRSVIQLPPLLLTNIYSPEVAGYYSLIQRVLGTPLTFIGRAIAQVSLGDLGTRLRTAGDNKSGVIDLYKMLIRTLLIGGVLIGLMGLTVSFTTVYLFGSKWQMAGFIALILTPAYLLQFIAVPLSQFLIALKRQEHQLFSDSMATILIAAVFYIAHVNALNPIFTIILLSLAMSLSYTYIIIMTNRVVNTYAYGEK